LCCRRYWHRRHFAAADRDARAMNENNDIEHFSTQYHRCGALWTTGDSTANSTADHVIASGP